MSKPAHLIPDGASRRLAVNVEGDESRPKGSADYQYARALLETGCVVLGEVHTNPAAREFILELIKDGSVVRLFLELPDAPLTPSGAGMGDALFGTYVRDRLGQDLSEDLHLKALAPAFNRSHANPSPLSKLIVDAVRAEVKVHFMDVDEGAGGWKRRKPMDKAATSLADRNTAMGKNFRDVVAPDPQTAEAMSSAKTVLLVGATHLTVRPTMMETCRLDPHRAIDLSCKEYEPPPRSAAPLPAPPHN